MLSKFALLRYCAFVLALVINLPASAGLSPDFRGHGDTFSECLANPYYGNLAANIKSLECEWLYSIDEVELPATTRLIAFSFKQQPLASKTEKQFPNISKLLLGASDWTPEDIAILARHFPNVETFICQTCNLYTLSAVIAFPKLNTISVDMAPVIPGQWRGPTIAEDEFTFDGLPYDQIGRIMISPTVNTAFSCRSLGIWSYKLYQGFWFHNHLPKPYKDYYSCYPDIEQLSGLIGEGDKAYKAGKLKLATVHYQKAFEINPWDQKAISSLALAAFKQGEYCRAAQIGYAGIDLPNGNNTTRASIWYNYALAVKELGDVDEYLRALGESEKLKPMELKRKKIAAAASLPTVESKACKLDAQWISAIRATIETNAVLRTRGEKKN